MPSLKVRLHAGLLTRLCALHKSEPLGTTQEVNQMENELLQPPVTLHTKSTVLKKERKKNMEGDGGQTGFYNTRPEMYCATSGRDAAYACLMTAAMATHNKQSPSIGEG